MHNKINEVLKYYEITEIMKCSNDPIYFIEQYISTMWSDRHGESSLYQCQKEMLSFYDTYNSTIGLLSRQTGFTSITSAYILWKILFEPNQRIAIYSPTMNSSTDIIDRIAIFHFNLPKFLQIPGKFNKWTIELVNGSNIVTGSFNNWTPTKAQSLTMAFFDNMAYGDQRNIRECWLSTTLRLMPSGKLIIGSAPNYAGDLFGKLWKQSTDNGINNVGTNNIKPFQISWQDVPKFSREEFKDDMIRKIGYNHFLKEYDCTFSD